MPDRRRRLTSALPKVVTAHLVLTVPGAISIVAVARRITGRRACVNTMSGAPAPVSLTSIRRAAKNTSNQMSVPPCVANGPSRSPGASPVRLSTSAPGNSIARGSRRIMTCASASVSSARSPAASRASRASRSWIRSARVLSGTTWAKRVAAGGRAWSEGSSRSCDRSADAVNERKRCASASLRAAVMSALRWAKASTTARCSLAVFPMDVSRDWAFQARRMRRFCVKDRAERVPEEMPVLLLFEKLSEVDLQLGRLRG
jgi:hypothetical protein